MSGSTALSTVISSAGGELLPATASHDIRFEVPSSDGSRAYVIARCAKGVNKGQFQCGCPGWITRRKCKHLSAIGPSLKLIESAAGAGF